MRDFSDMSEPEVENYLRSQATLRHVTLVVERRADVGWYAGLKQMDPETADPEFAPDGIGLHVAEGGETRGAVLRALAQSVDLENEKRE
jgi:hypothetical protein